MRNQSISLVAQLWDAGVIPSYDYLGKGLIDSGEISKLVEEHKIGKFTSNQSIFLKDLSSGVYDSRIKKLLDKGKSAEEIYDILYQATVKEACGLLSEKHKQDPDNYFVSIETNPLNADDTQLVLKEARRLNEIAVNEDTKIAATPEGIDAIQQAVSEGLDINVTLIFPGLKITENDGEYEFSAPQFESVLKAVEEGYTQYFKNNPNASFKDIPRVVLSVFLSRVDTTAGAADEKLKQLEEKGEITKEEYLSLRGKTGMYAAKIIYQIWKNKMADSSVFNRLQKEDVALPRLLWASTQPKKDYIPDLQYVEPLQSPVGIQMINTITPKTFDDFKKNGIPKTGTIEDDLDKAINHVLRLQELKIDLIEIGDMLTENGIEKFADAYNDTIRRIKEIIQISS